MPTLMRKPTFDMLKTIWHQLAVEPALAQIGPSYIFVPWAGKQVISTKRGIYYVGIATNADRAGEDEQDFEVALRGTETFCSHPTLGYTPFWQFLDALSRELLGGPYDARQDRWGWSNMFKIAGTSGSPPQWPKALFDLQRPTCTAALQEEIGQLRDSLIVVTSVHDYGILHNVAGAQGPWDKQPRAGRTYFTHDRVAGNTFVHCYHPRYMRLHKFFDAAVTEVIRFSRETLAPF